MKTKSLLAREDCLSRSTHIPTRPAGFLVKRSLADSAEAYDALQSIWNSMDRNMFNAGCRRRINVQGDASGIVLHTLCFLLISAVFIFGACAKCNKHGIPVVLIIKAESFNRYEVSKLSDDAR